MIVVARCKAKGKLKPVGCVVTPKYKGLHVVYPFSIGTNHYSYTDEYVGLPEYVESVSDLYDLRSVLLNAGYSIDWEVYQKLLTWDFT